MYCEHCGAKLEDGARYCWKCGARIEEEETAVRSEEKKKSRSLMSEHPTDFAE